MSERKCCVACPTKIAAHRKLCAACEVLGRGMGAQSFADAEELRARYDAYMQGLPADHGPAARAFERLDTHDEPAPWRPYEPVRDEALDYDDVARVRVLEGTR